MSQQEETNGEEQPDAQPVFPSRGPDREEMASDYLPESDDWEAKTVLDLTDPAAVSALTQMGTMFPEVEDLQPLIDDFLHHHHKSRTSVAGKSREEYRNILVSMYGGNIDEDTARSVVIDAFASNQEDD